MNKQTKHLSYDLLIVTVSIVCAIFLVEEGFVSSVVTSLGNLGWLGIIIAGSFFTSIFTTAPAIAILGTFAMTTSLPELVILGAFGAMCGDYIIFRFVKDRVSGDFNYILSFAKGNRLAAIFRTKLFRFFVPFIGALIIASPFPDEIGVAMIGASKVRGRVFFCLSFVANALGILVIWLAARAVTGL